MKKYLIAIAATLVAMSMIIPVSANGTLEFGGLVSNQPYTQDVPTEATIPSSSGSPPEMKYIWVLPDEDTSTPYTQLNIQPSDYKNDIYAYVVAKDPQGRDDIQKIYVDVFYPQINDTYHGQKKYEVEAQKLDPVNDESAILQAMQDALDAGLITQSEYDDIYYEIFSQPEAYMWEANLHMWYCQPAGRYLVQGWGTDTRSEVSQRIDTYMDWLATVVLEIDFQNGINYGDLQPGVEKVVQGDYDITTSTAPTVKNEGNVPVKIEIYSTPLVHEQYDKEITTFDYQFLGVHKTYQAKKWTNIGTLDLCHIEKLDLSVKADVGLPAGHYSGTLTLRISQGAWGSP